MSRKNTSASASGDDGFLTSNGRVARLCRGSLEIRVPQAWVFKVGWPVFCWGSVEIRVPYAWVFKRGDLNDFFRVLGARLVA